MPKIRLPSLPKRKPKMIKEENKMGKIDKENGMQKDDTTFNDVFMFLIGDIESYTTLIAILGGPALLIIKDALDVWKTEQVSKAEFYKTKAQAVIDMNMAHQKQLHDVESKHQQQMHLIEQKEQSNEHGLTAPPKSKK